MKHAVILKSYAQGINLILDAEEDFETLLQEIGNKFRESTDFFKEAKIALSIEGRELNHQEVARVIDVIESNSAVKVLCIIGRSEEENNIYVKALAELGHRFPTPEDQLQCQIHKGNITDGQTIQVTQSLVVLGDVEKGALVVSEANVLVMGSLQGEVFCGAGKQTDENAFVLALDFEPERVKIGPYRVSDKELKSKRPWSQRSKGRKNKCPLIAFLDKTQEKIQVEPVDSARFAELFG